MKAQELIGKLAVRTKPAMASWGREDGSYRTSPIFIKKVTETHIVYINAEDVDSSDFELTHSIKLLPIEWCDDNWIDYDELINLTETMVDKANDIIARVL